MRYATLASLLLVSTLLAQSPRDRYRAPYQAWRQTAPALEQSASAPTTAFAEQVRATSEAAQVFLNARAAAFLDPFPGAAEQAAWGARPLATAEAMLTVPQEVQQMLAVAAAKVGSNINAFSADDKDAAIRRVRQSMERERAALRALTDALAAEKGTLAELIEASDEAEIQRALVGQALITAAGQRMQLAEHVKREAIDWAAYYKDLLEGATANGRISTSSATPGNGAAPAAAPAKILRPANNGQIQMTRYTGEWIFPSKGLFYGPTPESVEMAVDEANGTMHGTLTAKFSTPAAALTLEFQGPVQQGKTQTFAVPFSDGTSGTLELIPGTAFNLLEVNFQSAPRAGSVSTANFVLVKR
jgi:hypothetical protein